ncbi:MAG TPA: hypothetical protein VKY51_08645 [Fredinandcohnia sp.]|nr:hypothetical protein [Fredinandcohnia sp.]
MRYVLASFLSFVLALPLATHARSIDHPTWHSARWPKNTVSFDALGMGLGVFGIEYERAVAERISLYGSPRYLDRRIDGLHAEGFGLDAGARFFVSGQAPEGLFLSPAVGLYLPTAGDRLLGWTATALVGHTWLIDRSFDISLGFGAVLYDLKEDGRERRAIMPTGRISIGAAF